ncbi:hypothetical protein PVA44_04155 [Entomospira nematocerorum]|uniref:Tetratricopeptide repeat protein n=1 Tax=Entomospira nematocerorum TaxID=2719987 RepID=A0A968GEF8_9SPIO|nr:hypothetical protein [Entomospira nematocera]NIZ46780.1 hypothetical protein [Entomospira nematocera]WDI33423.1 hypothetical protein PVA44_04155 [Entomospira nematocera]
MKGKTIEEALALLNQKGFKRTSQPVLLPTKERIMLIRKGNELWQNGDITSAERIFVTVGYQDGLIRLGDWYYQKKSYIEALNFYKRAQDSERTEKLAIRMAQVLSDWINEE